MKNRQACIVGIGESAYARWGGIKDRGEFDLTVEAVLKACADAGLPPRRVDGFASFSEDRNEPSVMMSALGTEQLRLSAMVWGGGGGGSCGALALAASAVESGRADHVAVYRGLCQGQYFRFGQFHPWSPHAEFTAPFGLLAPAQMFALMMRRHMHLYGTTSEHLAEVALTCRANANRNPRAVMYGRPLDLDTYMASPMVADPLRRHDCCLESDGAAAAIVTTMERARDLDAAPVRILAAAQGSSGGWGTGMLGGHNMPDDIYASGNGRAMAGELYGAAGVGPGDIDVAQLYDAFTGTVLMALEDYGFCGVGESGAFVADGNIRWDGGKLPVNTAGGLLSEAYIHGFNLVLEGVRQMRGQSTAQVNGAGLCLVSGGEGVTPTSAAILARD
jgi:acetyl-CoA acetyltransferase